MDHSLYRPEDFACDESYLRYYFKLDEKDISYWEQWIRTHPEKLDIVMSADQLIGFLSLQLPEEEFRHEYERFTRAVAKAALPSNAIRDPIIDTHASLPAGISRPRRRSGLWLLTIAMVLVAGSAYLFEYRHKPSLAQAALPGSIQHRLNTGSGLLGINLEEGSVVRLQPGASLSWPEHFDTDKREAVLEGSALVSVSPNPRLPFLLYCSNLVVQATGTGLAIAVSRHDNAIEVAVSSGRAEVYEKNTAGRMVLTPGQKLTYITAGRQFTVTCDAQ
jgi:ferric-dicitrate binding protein FerR (iron transport regulator)